MLYGRDVGKAVPSTHLSLASPESQITHMNIKLQTKPRAVGPTSNGARSSIAAVISRRPFECLRACFPLRVCQRGRCSRSQRHMKADIFKLQHPLISTALLRHYWELVHSVIMWLSRRESSKLYTSAQPLRITEKQWGFIFNNYFICTNPTIGLKNRPCVYFYSLMFLAHVCI